MSEYRNIAIVNDRDEIIGSAPLLEAIEKGLLRRSCRVCVFNQAGEVLIQRRSKNVFLPLLNDFSVAGHVDEGETYEAAAVRELIEELNIRDLPITTVSTSFRSHDFFSSLYKVILPGGYPLIINTEEIDSIAWYVPSEIDSSLGANPELFTPEFIRTWQLFRDKIVGT